MTKPFYKVRNVDSLGRFCLPIEGLRNFNFRFNEPKLLEIYVEDDSIILKKYTKEKCVFCKSEKSLTEFKKKKICIECLTFFREKIKMHEYDLLK
jgi:bifunctional DNA-binding transcriptional regulator/antitoxin component of YhaV-PrlF toxin-antitoxin module